MSDKLEERAPPVALCPAFTFNAPTDPDDMSIYIRTVSFLVPVVYFATPVKTKILVVFLLRKIGNF